MSEWVGTLWAFNTSLYAFQVVLLAKDPLVRALALVGMVAGVVGVFAGLMT